MTIIRELLDFVFAVVLRLATKTWYGKIYNGSTGDFFKKLTQRHKGQHRTFGSRTQRGRCGLFV